jgi:hypothetical protein
MVRAKCTRDSGRFCIGSGRFEMRNTLRPSVDMSCGELQGDPLVSRTFRELSGWLSGEMILKGCPLGLIYSTMGRYMRI